MIRDLDKLAQFYVAIGEGKQGNVFDETKFEIMRQIGSLHRDMDDPDPKVGLKEPYKDLLAQRVSIPKF